MIGMATWDSLAWSVTDRAEPCQWWGLDRPGFVPRTLWDVHAPLRRGAVGTGDRAVQQALKVALRDLLVFGRGHPVTSDRFVLAGASVRFPQPIDVRQGSQRHERHLRRPFRQH